MKVVMVLSIGWVVSITKCSRFRVGCDSQLGNYETPVLEAKTEYDKAEYKVPE
jgi:hypothetical protein